MWYESNVKKRDKITKILKPDSPIVEHSILSQA